MVLHWALLHGYQGACGRQGADGVGASLVWVGSQGSDAALVTPGRHDTDSWKNNGLTLSGLRCRTQ